MTHSLAAALPAESRYSSSHTPQLFVRDSDGNYIGDYCRRGGGGVPQPGDLVRSARDLRRGGRAATAQGTGRLRAAWHPPFPGALMC